MRSFTILVIVYFFFFSLAQGQVVFWTDDFDSTGPTSGDRDAINHADRDNGSNTSVCQLADFFFRTNLASDPSTGMSAVFTGFTGSYWRGQDLEDCMGSPDIIEFNNIDITGLSDFRFTGSFAALTNLWEADDFLSVEYRIDNGTWNTGILFSSNLALGTRGSLAEDLDQDGFGEGTTLDQSLTAFSFTFNASGTDLDLRFQAGSNGASEEFAIEDFILEHSFVLPVELIGFNGKLKNKEVELNWSTASEINNAGFEIQRSNDGRHWELLDFVHGAGNSDITITYQYIDSEPMKGIQYYRLRQVDFDNRHEFSQTISINYSSSTGELGELYPNPTENGIVYINYDSNTRERLNIKVHNLVGQVVFQESREAGMGTSQLELDLRTLGKGLFLVSIEESSSFETFSKKLAIH